MSLIEDIRDIQNNSLFQKDTTPPWEHNERIMSILKRSGEYRIPAPKSYITADYIPPSNLNSQLNSVGRLQFTGKINSK